MIEPRIGPPETARKPVVGPYGTVRYDPHRRRWYGVLNEEGRRKLTAYLKKYPDPTMMLSRSNPNAWDTLTAAGMNREDVESAASIALVTAMIRYEPVRDGRPVKFSTVLGWAFKAMVTNAYRDHLRRVWARPLAAFSDGELEDVPDREEPDPLTSFDREDVWQLLDRLTPRERDVVRLKYGLGVEPQAMADIGRLMCPPLSRERVRQIAEKAERRLMELADPDLVDGVCTHVASVLASGPASVDSMSSRGPYPASSVKRAVRLLSDDGMIATDSRSNTHFVLHVIWYLTEKGRAEYCPTP